MKTDINLHTELEQPDLKQREVSKPAVNTPPVAEQSLVNKQAINQQNLNKITNNNQSVSAKTTDIPIINNAVTAPPSKPVGRPANRPALNKQAIEKLTFEIQSLDKQATDIQKLSTNHVQKKPAVVNTKPVTKSPAAKSAKRLDFAIDYNIPTLDEIAVPGGDADRSNKTSQIPIPKHILKPDISIPPPRPKTDEVTLTADLIEQLSEELQLALNNEIEKAISYALSSALATVIDQATKATKTIVRTRVAELLPKLLKEHLKNISPE